MELAHTTIHVSTDAAGVALGNDVRAVASLHSHSNASRETLTFILDTASRIPFVSGRVSRELLAYERRYGRPLDVSAGFWRPPLTPAAVIASERRHIERQFDRPALVSLTDHDTLDGVTALRAAGDTDVPLAFEWTVPFRDAVFQLGVYGLPPDRAAEIVPALAAYTAGAAEARPLADLLAWLDEGPGTCVVVNHPYWDLADIGPMRHDSALLAFMRAHRDRLHALELNGYRTWHENRRVLPLADGFALPLTGGGDRHGCLPNTILSLTAAQSFDEFVSELRAGRSTCVVLPEYQRPFNARVLEGAADVIGHSDEDGCGWDARVFVPDPAGVVRPVWAIWRAPWWVTASIGVTGLLAAPALRHVFRLTRSDGCDRLADDCAAHRGDYPRPVGGSTRPSAA